MYRRFVNLIVHNERTELYSLRRLGIIPHLFHEPRAAADAQVATANKKGYVSSTVSSWNGLPRSDINFALPPRLADTTGVHFFSLLRGQGEGCVMFVGPYGQTTVYDVAMDSVIVMPHAGFFVPSDSIALPMIRRADSGGICYHDHDQLYVIGGSGSKGLFEVFNYCKMGAPTVGFRGWWSWQHVPSPPQVEDPYQPGANRRRLSAAAVVDETTICASSIDGGAYTCDTVECEWRQAGSWVLPFHGAAEHVPKLGLWFGLEATAGNPHHRLCAFDLSSSSWPPVRIHCVL